MINVGQFPEVRVTLVTMFDPRMPSLEEIARALFPCDRFGTRYAHFAVAAYRGRCLEYVRR